MAISSHSGSRPRENTRKSIGIARIAPTTAGGTYAWKMVLHWYYKARRKVACRSETEACAIRSLQTRRVIMSESQHVVFGESDVVLPQGGPLYLQLRRWIGDAIARGDLKPGDALPSERDLALKVAVSRVTVRKAVQHLVREGVLVQRHGSGTFVAPQANRVEQSLSQLTSFAEDMARRGMAVRSVWLDRGIYDPSPEETMILGLSSGEQVARVARLRISGDTPLAIERAALSTAILPDPHQIGTSLYAHLDKTGNRPVRAIQRIRAANLIESDARLLDVPAGAAGLYVERISYLGSGRVIEFTRSIYRGDTYDFVAELRIGNDSAQRGGRK